MKAPKSEALSENNRLNKGFRHDGKGGYLYAKGNEPKQSPPDNVLPFKVRRCGKMRKAV
ncbi:MAG: hypothetical protein HRU20_30160 [Pseudomonadales bacterium]|nr:hypothetical protein [Pseudomonadales bacterium]